MTQRNHTPGPWDAVAFRGCNPTEKYAIGPTVLERTADAYGEANARLISASPELLEELSESTDMLERILESKDWGAIEEQIRDNRAAIAKATGEQ